MQFEIPLDTLFTDVFGIASPLIRRYKIKEEDKTEYNPLYKVNMGQEQQDDELIQSSLGTPVHFPMGFIGNTDYNYRKDGRIQKKFMRGVYMPFSSVASFSRAKRLTETFMVGQNGSVIEEYGFEPWEIRVQGFIIKNDKALVSGNSTVEDQVRELKDWESLSDSVGVKGKMFEWLGIYKAAIIKLDFPMARNLDMNVIKPFEMSMRSVEPIELIIK